MNVTADSNTDRSQHFWLSQFDSFQDQDPFAGSLPSTCDGGSFPPPPSHCVRTESSEWSGFTTAAGFTSVDASLSCLDIRAPTPPTFLTDDAAHKDIQRSSKRAATEGVSQSQSALKRTRHGDMTGGVGGVVSGVEAENLAGEFFTAVAKQGEGAPLGGLFGESAHGDFDLDDSDFTAIIGMCTSSATSPSKESSKSTQGPSSMPSSPESITAEDPAAVVPCMAIPPTHHMLLQNTAPAPTLSIHSTQVTIQLRGLRNGEKLDLESVKTLAQHDATGRHFSNQVRLTVKAPAVASPQPFPEELEASTNVFSDGALMISGCADHPSLPTRLAQATIPLLQRACPELRGRRLTPGVPVVTMRKGGVHNPSVRDLGLTKEQIFSRASRCAHFFMEPLKPKYCGVMVRVYPRGTDPATMGVRKGRKALPCPLVTVFTTGYFQVASNGDFSGADLQDAFEQVLRYVRTP